MNKIIEECILCEKKDYLVSAIVSVYNAEKFIAGCIDDLINQTIADKIEIIIIDSNSQQNERKIIEQYLTKHSNITYIRTNIRENVYAAWNRGIIKSHGKYITNANCDDRHHVTCLELLAKGLDSHPNHVLAYGSSFISNIANESFFDNDKSAPFTTPTPFSPAILLYYPFGPHPMWRRTLHNKVGYFDATYSAAGDWDFGIRSMLQGKAIHIPEAIGIYLMHKKSITFRDNTMEKENQRIRKFWHKVDVIKKLYEIEGAHCNNPEQLAYVYYDMGIRSLEFYTPWSVTNPDQDLGLARRCFLHALRLAPNWEAPKLSLANIDALQGKLPKAVAAMELLTTGRYAHQASDNQKILKYFTTKPCNLYALKHIETNLDYPSQLELAACVTNNQIKTKTYTKFSNKIAAQDNKTKPLVLLFGEFFWPSRGGIETFLEELGETLCTNGYDPYVVTKPNSERKQNQHKNIKIIEAPFWGNFNIELMYNTNKFISNNNIKCAIIIGHPDQWWIPAIKILKKKSVRIIAIPSINKEDFSLFSHNKNTSHLHFIIACADEIVRCSESGFDSKLLNNLGVPNHFIPHSTNPSPSADNFRDTYGFSHDKPLLVMASNFWPIKNHIGLLQVLSHYKEQWQLAIIGNPHRRDYYSAVCSLARNDPRVRILGLLPREQTQAAIRDADILLLPSKGESAGPYVVIEAMALGTPWIATPECNAVFDEAGGLVVEIEKFPKAIHSLLNDKIIAKSLGMLGFAHWECCFTWKKSILSFISLIENTGVIENLRMPPSLRRANIAIQKKLIG